MVQSLRESSSFGRMCLIDKDRAMKNVKGQKYIDWLSGKNKILNICVYIVFVLVVPCTANSAVFNISSGDVAGLIDAINAANANAEPDTINLEAGTYTLTDPDNFTGNGLGFPVIISPITIVGSGAASTIIERDSGPSVFSFNFFFVNPTGDLTLDSLTLKGGRSANSGGGAILTRGKLTIANSIISNNFSPFFGGAINNGSFFITDGAGPGILIITNSILRDNIANGDGGAISSSDGAITITGSTFNGNFSNSDGGAIGIFDDNLTISDSIITGNSADQGGGIDVEAEDNPGVVIINNSTISNNSATHDRGDGGGINIFDGTMIITGSTISNNTAGERGGGMRNVFSDITILNSTISGNLAGDSGGGIYNDPLGIDNPDLATVELNNVTIAFNTADSDSDGIGDGGGIFNNGKLELSNTIIANNIFGTDCDGDFGVIFSNGYNIDSDGTCNLIEEGDKPFTNPLLDILAPNGGPTNTHALLAGSPAIDMGDPSGCLDAQGFLLNEDQRGFPRPQGVGCDIGAYEAQISEPPPAPPDSEAQMAIRIMLDNLMKVLLNMAPQPTVTRPSLLTPINNETIEQNNPNIGCPFSPTAGYGHEIFFDWTDSSSPNGIKGYHLFVKNLNAINPVFSGFVLDSDFTLTSCNAFVVDRNLNNWIWTVQAEDNLGNLSSIATGQYMYEPCRLDDGSACNAPP